MSIALDALLLASGWAHVLLAPYTKVEESFNLHATHDVLMYGVGPITLYNYDHFIFPGAVPRTFIGSTLLAWLSTPVIQLANWRGLVSNKFDIQIIVRLVLASINAVGLCLIRRAVNRRFGRPTSLFFTLLSVSQFHIPFWMGRTLPNMFALLPVNLSTYLILDRPPNARRPSVKNISTAISLLTFTAVIFRAEVALLLAPIVLQSLYLRYIGFFSIVKVGFFSALAAIALSVSVDSYFWDKYLLWPEFSSIYFNIYEGKSSDWGVSPFHTYFSTDLPKLLLASLPLAILGTLLDARIRRLLFPCLAFLTLISFLGHKEWRFIVYVVPMFNVAAARGARWMVSRPKNSFLGRILFLTALGLVIVNMSITALHTVASMVNYPGGEALALFNQQYSNMSSSMPVHVHISNLAAQTGASLFLQINSSPYPPTSLVSAPSNLKAPLEWTYDKTESLTPQSLTASGAITHLISESPLTTIPSKLQKQWQAVESVEGFDRWVVDWDLIKGKDKEDILERLPDVLKMGKSEKLWILERKR